MCGFATKINENKFFLIKIIKFAIWKYLNFLINIIFYIKNCFINKNLTLFITENFSFLKFLIDKKKTEKQKNKKKKK